MSDYEDVVELAKRRGFFWPAFSIYGGQAGFYDYGPVGVLLKDNIISVWKKSYLMEDAIFIDSPNITPTAVLRASGHLEKFADLAAMCSKCKSKFKLETLLKGSSVDTIPKTKDEADAILRENVVKCINCGNRISDAYSADLMFKVDTGQSEDPSYLRPETAQGMFVNFKLLNSNYRGRLPMAVAQLGKGFRNEISPRQSLIRMREFYQGEVEVFFKDRQSYWKEIPDGRQVTFKPSGKDPVTMTVKEANESGLIKDKALSYFVNKTLELLLQMGLSMDRLRFRQHDPDELAHYSTDCWDAEALVDGDWVEIVGISDRGTYDLERHQKYSGENMTVNIDGELYLPRVIEPAHGIDRIFMALMIHSFYKRENGYKVVRLTPELAPYKIAVLPLMKKDGMREYARDIYEKINSFEPSVVYDETGTIGKRYARQDEVGTPFCLTVDYQTLEDGTATVRFRDSTEQTRIRLDDLLSERRVIGNSRLTETTQP